MRWQELGYAIRQARLERGLTQARLAASARLSRTTLNQLENGLFPDLGVRKLQAVLEQLGLTLAVQNAPKSPRPDFVRMACTAANVSYKTPLTEDELIHALISGKIPRGKRPHLRALLDEVAPPLLRGLVKEASQWTKPGRVERNLAAIGREVGASRRIEEWLKTA
jgi:transcriptional regulator with XRE-family HTH domain